MVYVVRFAPRALTQLDAIYSYVAARGGRRRALAYTRRISAYCRGFAIFPLRGTQRDDLRPGVRLVGFERRVLIVFEVTDRTVNILGILYGGQRVEAMFNPRTEQ